MLSEWKLEPSVQKETRCAPWVASMMPQKHMRRAPSDITHTERYGMLRSPTSTWDSQAAPKSV